TGVQTCALPISWRWQIRIRRRRPRRRRAPAFPRGRWGACAPISRARRPDASRACVGASPIVYRARPMQVSAWATAALVLAAFAAGLVDAVAGGSGVIAVPALLAAGLPPHLALGTNKAQGVFGTFASTLSYPRAGLLDRK